MGVRAGLTPQHPTPYRNRRRETRNQGTNTNEPGGCGPLVVRARGPEAFIGTDPADPCPDDATDDAWPMDFDMNTTVNIIDVLFFATPISGEYDSRYDLNANGVVNIIDVLMFAPFIMQSCSNP